MIKAIIFDFAGIITYEGSIRVFSKEHSKDYDEKEEDFNNKFKKHWDIAKVGEIDSDEFWKRFAEDIKTEKNRVRIDLIDYLKVNDGIIEVIKDLKTKYKIGILSNQIKDWIETKLNEGNLWEVFDDIIISSEVKLAKPDKRIYELAAKRFGVKPEECIFIDDHEKNVRGAEEAGMKGILFTNLEDLKEKLKEYGVDI